MDWLFARPTPEEANHWLAILSLVIFAIGTIGCIILTTRPDAPPFKSRYTQAFVSKVCISVGWTCGVGLFFGIIRFLQIDPVTLGRGIWILLSWIALIVVVAWLAKQAPADHKLRVENDARLETRRVGKASEKPKH